MAKPRRAMTPDEIEAVFADHDIDLLVDGDRLFLEAEVVPELAEDGMLVEEPEGGAVVLLGRRRFRLGPYDPDADGYPVLGPA